VHYRNFGWHLTIDAKNCETEVCLDVKAVSQFLKKLVKDTNMVPVGEPIVVYHQNAKEGIFGLSAVQIIETSDITLHFDTKTKESYFDLFSCRKFSPKKVIKDFQDFCSPSSMITRFFKRNALSI
jgi:S-adenosylmethionine/arginine decarboxylase-like enzyme